MTLEEEVRDIFKRFNEKATKNQRKSTKIKQIWGKLEVCEGNAGVNLG